MRTFLVLAGAIALLTFGCGDSSPDAEGDSLAAPSNLTLALLSGGVHLTWRDQETREENIEIERKRDPSTFSKIATLVFDSLQYHDADVDAGVEYTYRVRVVSSTARSAYSNEVSITIPGTVTDAGVRDASVGDAGIESLDASVGSDGGATALSFANDIVPILNASCGGLNSACHARDAYAGDPQKDCRGWLALENIPLGSTNPVNGSATGCPDRTLYQRLMQLSAWMCEPERAYVVASSPESSHLYNMIVGDPTEGGQCEKRTGVPTTAMPPVGSGYQIDQAQREKMADWIRQGALNN